MKAFLAILRRDLRLSLGSGGIGLPIVFFLLVATLYPFAVGPDGALLARTGGGVLWVAALLAALLPVDRLIAPDAEAGVLDQYAVRGIGEEMISAAKITAHWIGFGPPLMLAALPASAMLRLDGETLAAVELGLLCGTPGLAALGVMVASLTAGLRRGGALSGLLMLPLAIPLIIFGAGSIGDFGGGAVRFLAASSLFLVAVAPFAAGAGIRALRE
ncbi:heme exporter protein CcmB [Chakrabartia godavariana]|nr:heme exporter protein CcmB [Chakrabartia godavariana]